MKEGKKHRDDKIKLRSAAPQLVVQQPLRSCRSDPPPPPSSLLDHILDCHLLYACSRFLAPPKSKIINFIHTLVTDVKP